ncbi:MULTISPECIES: type VI secretion system baseplate subunit TssE [Pseudomonas]|uniref:type VI secretion system baseplate subunit TssE n=1 Tax=Pseudomonas TaxID=286 RepID=UPI0006D422D3|nr:MULTISPECIES: type VI secretion system baseplate subunit TssE [unclassified Pseudomonas]OBY90665.1 type VI secretion system lysozyme-like protein [Pseudomonas sp. AU11447]
MSEQSPSLYELLLQNFTGELDLQRVSEADQPLLSVLDNLRRILNCRAGTLSHLPDYGLPDMSQILQGMPGSAHGLMGTMTSMLLKYEPRLASLQAVLLPQTLPGHLQYSLEVELRDGTRATFGTTLDPQGKVLMRHLRQQEYLVR